jgi:hypothetical protein
MVTSYDKEYKITKLVKQGKATMPDQFRPLAEWIDQTYHVKTLHIILDVIEPHQRPRLNIIFEFSEEEIQFSILNNRFNYDEEKQQAIADRYREINSQKLQSKMSLFQQVVDKYFKPKKNLLVVFSSFKPLAREEANEKISQAELENLMAEIGNKDLWTISNQFAGATFFLYTDEQVKHYASIGIEPIYTDKYFKLLKEYDEFGYFRREEFHISLDSKENFDKKFGSNWYYYYH